MDKEKVQRVVYEMSKGSKYFENEERKEAFIRQKIERMRARSAKLTAGELSHYQTVLQNFKSCRVVDLCFLRCAVMILLFFGDLDFVFPGLKCANGHLYRRDCCWVNCC